jgi:hypothetical protein
MEREHEGETQTGAPQGFRIERWMRGEKYGLEP